MAGLKPNPIAGFYRLLHARGETAGTLARALGLTNHTYVSRLITGHGRRRDGVWWPRLRALLTAEELALIAPTERCVYPTLRAAIEALPSEPKSEPQYVAPARPVDPAVSAFVHWRLNQAQRRSA